MKTLKIFLYLNIPVGIMLLLLTGCSVKKAIVAPEGLLSVLGPFPGFSPENLPDDWAVVKNGNLDIKQIQIVTKDGLPSLKITNSENSFIVMRRTNAMMLATPFLSWYWLIDPPSTTGYHTIRMVVGFYGGDPKSRSSISQPFRWLGRSLPPHDRAINLVWGESALQRGTLIKPTTDSKNKVPLYIVRGGRENTGSWWQETVDLSSLYRQVWPQDNSANAKIVYIGIKAVADSVPAPAYVFDITLSH